VDLYGRPRLAELLRELENVEGIDWIRILYCYPQFFTDELYDVLAHAKKIIPYLDMPLQHINDRMLKLMNRRHTRAETEAIIGRLRSTIPGLALRTTFIVGFPGETDAEFAELVDFVEATRFERMGAFTYSLEPDTPAAKLPGHLPAELIASRRDRLMAVQQPIAFAFNRGLVGQTLDVMIDAPSPQGRHHWIGRTYADSPDVDAVVHVRGGPFRPGDIVPCEIVDCEEYDLIARASPAEPPRARKARPRPRRRPAASSLVILDDV
jgi:ribosomal protein S12 methylthiotransferase